MYGWRSYFDTKLALTIDTIGLARELAGTGVTCNAVHPGLVNTNLGRYMTPKFLMPFTKLMGMFILSPRGGAEPIINVACSDELEKTTGKYFHRFKERSPKKVSNEALNSKLLEYTLNLTNLN